MPKQYSIEQFYKNINYTQGSFSTDDKKLLTSSDESGIYNAYEIDVNSGEKKSLTNSTTESIFAADYVPGTDNFIYSSDSGGNENYHLFLRKTNGDVKDLTPGTKITNSFFGWSRDGKSMYFTSNKRDARYFDFYKMDTGTWSPTLLYKNEKGWDVNAISPDENYFLLVQNITSSSSNLYLADRKTVTTKKINSDSAESLSYGLQFSLDNKNFYYLTDDGGEFQHAMKYEIDSAKKENVFSAKWDVMYMYLSWNEKYRVIGVNEDGRNKIYLFDHQTGKQIDFPKIEDGDVQAVSISQSEKKMELYAGSSKSPANLYVYGSGTSTVRPRVSSASSRVSAPPAMGAPKERSETCTMSGRSAGATGART
jgi:Tol biopolymer transport system component